MQNRIPYSYPSIVEQYNEAIAGVVAHGTTLGLTLVQSATMTATLNALIAGEDSGKQARTELRNRQNAFEALTKSTRKYLVTARDALKPYLGTRYSPAWTEAGFIGGLEIPTKAEKVLTVLLALKAYFTAHPTHENEQMNATAEAANLFYTDMVAARNGVNSQITTWQLALATRDAKAEQARTDLRALIKELSIRMNDMDERWTAFGLNKPGQLATPPAPQKVQAQAIAPGKVSVKWEKAPRAKTYRIWKRLDGETEDYALLGTTSELVFVLEGLAAGVAMDIYVSASNNGGESPKSEKSTVTTT